MERYYNIVTNASGAIMLEDGQGMCLVEGQSVQFVVEDVNNSGNGSAQFIPYPAALQNSEQAIFSPQTINFGSQITTTQLDQRQFYIIETNDIPASQDILKTNVTNTQLVGENTVNIGNNGGTEVPLNKLPVGQNMQWTRMEDVNLDTVLSPPTLTPIENTSSIKNQQQNNISPSLPLHQQGQRSQSESQPYSNIDKKPVRLYQNRNKLPVSNVTQFPTASKCSRVGTTPSSEGGDCTINANLMNNKNITLFRSKTFDTPGSDVNQTRQVRPPIQPVTPQGRNSISPQIPRSPPALHFPEVEHLSERIKRQNKLRETQTQRQMQQIRQQSPQVITQRQQITMNQQQSINSTAQQQQQQQQQQPSPIVGRQRRPVPLTPPQQAQLFRQPMVSPQQRLECQPSTSASAHCAQQPMDIELSDRTHEDGKQNEPNCASQQESELNSPARVAYFKKMIDNPQTAIVKQQICQNTAKMLVILLNGEQRLITFDIPNEECTVLDLLEQAKIPFSGDTTVRLVQESAIGINYIVQARPGSSLCMPDAWEDDGTPAQEITNKISENSSPVANTSDESSNSSITPNEEPKFVSGKLAVCPHCGISSPDFNRCLRCKTKLPEDVKAIPIAMSMQGKKEMIPIDVQNFYKKSNEQSIPSKHEKQEREGSTVKRARGKGRATSRAKPVKEPECLIISSDEENDGERKCKRVQSDNNNSNPETLKNTTNEEMDMILEKEPIITNNSTPASLEQSTESNETTKDENMECDQQSILDGSIPTPHTTLSCRTVRIGSYKYAPREKVVISQNGLRLRVPLLEDDKNLVTLDVKLKDIVKVLIHFGKAMPVLFFYTTTQTGAMIRELLGMQDLKGPYYDPAGRDHTHKRITLLPERMNEESKLTLKSLFTPNDLLVELSPKEANDILVRASPKDSLQVQSLVKKMNTSSTNNTSVNGGIQTIMVYPPPPAKGGIAINTEDYACLGEDQFLNDVIIDFYLKYLTLEVLSAADQVRTHVLSSYFYKRLTSPHAPATESATPLSAAAKRHARVQKWTKNVNIFDKDFIIIPINERAHWFLAIICFPGLVGKVPVSSPITKNNDSQKTAQRSKILKEMKLQTVTIGSTTITPVATTITIDPGDEGSERDEAEGDDEEMEVDTDDDEEAEIREENANQPNKPSPAVEQEHDIVKIPCILIFDSLAGASRSRVVATLRDYLSCEYLAKMGTDQVFSKDTMKGASPKVPQQSNFTDCGVYVLQYVESFFKDPIMDYTLPIKSLRNWFEEIVVTRKREEISKLLIKLMNATKGDKNITLPTVSFPTQDGVLLPRPENHIEIKPVKSEAENKRKSTVDGETRLANTNNIVTTSENVEPNSDTQTVHKTTYQIIPYSPSSSFSSLDSTSTEMFVETKTLTRSSIETMNYLKTKRIPRLQLKTSESQDKQIAKKHKGGSFNSCK